MKTLRCLCLLLSTVCLLAGSSTVRAAKETKALPEEKMQYLEVKNPVFIKANDPWVTKHEGNYYYCFSDSANGISVKKISDLTKITTMGATQVWSPPADTDYSKELWAPELHYIDGSWYIYVAASNGENETHRMHVLKGTSQDPTQPFEYAGKISDESDCWAIDGTPFCMNGEWYFVWSGWEADVNVSQQLYIAHMDSPTSIDSPRVCISKPDLDWEKIGLPIEEGPEILMDEGKDGIFLVFSASGSWTDDYCMGMLTLEGEDPMLPESWKKGDAPVLSKKEGAYGPGHGSFVKADDDSWWIVYHCNQKSGSGWSGRSCWIQPFTWEEEMPYFGEPVTSDTVLSLPVMTKNN